MSAVIKIIVKNESIFVKASSLIGTIRIFQKSKMKFVLDGETHVLKAQNEAYTFEVTPGQHEIDFIDPRAKSKRRGKKFGSAVLGGAMGLGVTGSGWGALGGALEGISLSGSKKGGTAQIITLNDGDEIWLSCKADGKGVVKVEQV